MDRIMSPRIVLTVVGSNGQAPLPQTIVLSGTSQTVWEYSGSLNIGNFISTEYRDNQHTHLVVVQYVNTGSYNSNPALLSISWVPVESGSNSNVIFDVMSSQFVSDGLIHKIWSSVEDLVSDVSTAAVAAKASWPNEWITSGSMFIGAVIA